jgi:hypothetical protein
MGHSETTASLCMIAAFEGLLLSGKNEEAFLHIVEQIGQISAEKRGLSLPDNAAAGKRMGEIIKWMRELCRGRSAARSSQRAGSP